MGKEALTLTFDKRRGKPCTSRQFFIGPTNKQPLICAAICHLSWCLIANILHLPSLKVIIPKLDRGPSQGSTQVHAHAQKLGETLQL